MYDLHNNAQNGLSPILIQELKTHLFQGNNLPPGKL